MENIWFLYNRAQVSSAHHSCEQSHRHKREGRTVKLGASAFPPLSSKLPGGQKLLPELDQTQGGEQDEPCNTLLIEILPSQSNLFAAECFPLF